MTATSDTIAPTRVGELDMPAAWPGTGPSPAARQADGRRAESLAVEAGPVVPGASDAVRPPRREQRRWWRRTRKAKVHYPDGVLPPAGRDMTTLIATVGICAMGEAGWNVGRGVYEMLHLPLPLACTFPVVLEAASASFAVQEIRDRRQGKPNVTMEAGAYVGLAASAVVNGLVGWTSYGAGGLMEILPPVVLGGLFFVHGRRQSAAYRSRAKLSPEWQAEQLAHAQVSSALEGLPLLCGETEDGRATVALLRRRLEDGTLSPAAALIAAGWHDRESRLAEIFGVPTQTARRRRLETIAATVWPDGAPADPLPKPVDRRATGAPVAAARTAPLGASVTALVGTPGAPRTAPSSAPDAPRTAPRTAPSGAPSTAPGAPRTAPSTAPDRAAGENTLRMATDDELRRAVDAVLAENPAAGERTVGAYLREQLGLSASWSRLRPVLSAAKDRLTAAAGAEGGPGTGGGHHA